MARSIVFFLALALSGAALAAASATGVDILIVYYSQTGHTRAMAQAVAEGARGTSGVSVKLQSVEEVEIQDVLAAEAIILGSPVANANVVPEMQSFINSWPFRGEPMKDKLGAAFVSAGGFSAGEETAQLSLLRSMLCFGMITVGGPHWTGSFGASAIVDEKPFAGAGGALVSEQFLDKARALGRRVAETARRLQPAQAASPEVP